MAVLINGDELIVSYLTLGSAHADTSQFQDQHLQSGLTGGQAAAHSLLAAISDCTPRANDAPATTTNHNQLDVSIDGDKEPKLAEDLGSIIVQVFLNKAGLGAALIKVGLTSFPEYSQWLIPVMLQ